MAKADILLKVGIQFDPNAINTKAIKEAIVKQLSKTNVKIEKATFGSGAKTALISAFAKVKFRIADARFGRDGLTALRQQFKLNAFSIDNVRFTKRALQGLNKQLKGTRFQIASATPATGAQAAGTGKAAKATRDLSNSQDILRFRLAAVRKEFRTQIRGLQDFAVVTTGAERAQRNFLQTVAQGRVSIQGFGANIVKITQRFGAYLISIKGIILAQQAFSKSLEFIFKFDDALQNLAKIIDTSETSLTDLADGLFEVANATANSVTEVSASFGIFIRQGLTVEEALDRARIALIGVNAANISVSDSTKLVTVALRVFGDEIKDGVAALDILNATGDAAATTQDQIVSGILRSGSAAKAVGLSFGELNAIIAATVEQTQLSGSQIGSALKTIFARLATNTSGLREQANALGANIKPGEGLVTTLQKLADIFPNLTRDQQAQLVTLAAGKRRFTEFNAILQQLQKGTDGVSRVQELLQVQLDGVGNTAAKNAEELKKLSSRATQTANAFSQFIGALAEVGTGGGISGTVGDILDAFTDIGKTLTDVVKFVGTLRNDFIGVGDVIKNIGKAAFFVGVPIILRGLIGGAKTFLGIGAGITKVLGQSGKAQQGFNAQVNTGQSLAKKELAIHGLITKELQKQLRLRAQVNSIQTGGVTNQVNTLRRLQAAGATGTGAGGAGAGITGAFKGLAGRVGNIGKAIGGAVGNLGDFQKQMIKATIALQLLDVASNVANDFAESLEKSGDKTNAARIRLAESSIKTGVQIGLLGGPIAGAIAGLTAFGIGLVKFNRDERDRTALVEESVKGFRALNVAIGEVERTGSKDLIEAFKKVNELAKSEDPAEKAKALLEATTFVSVALRAFESETSNINRAFKQSGELLVDVTREIAIAIRESKIDEAVQDAAAALQEQTFRTQATGATGQTGFLKNVADLNAKIAGLVVNTTDKLEEQESILVRVRQATAANALLNRTALERQELGVATDADLLKSTNSRGAALENLIKTEERLDVELKTQLKTLEEQVKQFTAGAELTDRLNKLITLFGKGAKTSNEFVKEFQGTLEIAGVDAKRIAEIMKVIEGTSKNVSDINKQFNNFLERRGKLQAKELSDNQKLAVLIGQISVAAQADVIALQKQVSVRTANLNILREQANFQIAIGRASINANTFAERQVIIQDTINAKKNLELSITREKLQTSIKDLQVSLAAAEAASDTKSVERIKEAIAETKRLAAEQSRLIEQEFDIKIRVQLEKEALATFTRAEQALTNFRIRQIQQVIREEEQAANRRIDFIRRIGETAAGREFIRQTPELRPTPGTERQFGTVRAAIIDQLTDATEVAVAGMVAELQQLRVSGVNTFQEINSLERKAVETERELAELRQKGSDPAKIKEAEVNLQKVQDSIAEVTERGADDFKTLEKAGVLAIKALAANETVNAEKRKSALELVEEASKRATDAQTNLATELNKVPSLNQKIIASQKNLAKAEFSVEEATISLVSANQKLADANFKLAFNVGLAEFKAKQASGGFAGISEAIGSLEVAFNDAVTAAKGSFQAILEARREVLQQELSLVQGQLQSFKSLALQAATADPEQQRLLRQQAAAGEQIAQGADVSQFPPEILQGLSAFANTIPGLEQALIDFGAAQLGIDPGTFDTLEQQLIELQTGIAETGQLQVQQAEQQVRTAQQQLTETQASRNLAQQQLDNAIIIKNQQLQVVGAASENAIVARVGFGRQINETKKIFAQSRRGTEASKQIEAGIKFLNTIEAQSFEAIKQLAIDTGEQTGIIKKQGEDTTAISGNISTLVGNSIVDAATQIRAINELGFIKTGIITGFADLLTSIGILTEETKKRNASIPTGGSATGTLSNAEINGVIAAASREKGSMPAGSRLMLANTSETVLTRKQAKKIGVANKGFIPNAQEGTDIISATAILQPLTRAIERLSANVSAVGPVQVNVDTQRRITVDGIDSLNNTIQEGFREKLAEAPSEAELQAVQESIVQIIERLKEQGNEDFTNL